MLFGLILLSYIVPVLVTGISIHLTVLVVVVVIVADLLSKSASILSFATSD